MFLGKCHQVISPDNCRDQIQFLDPKRLRVLKEVAARWQASAPGLARGRPGARAWASAAGRARGQLAGTGRGRPSTRGQEREARGMTTIEYLAFD